MSQTETVKNTVKTTIEEVAEQFVMGDASDPSALGELSGAFSGISENLQEHFPLSSRAARMAADLLQEAAQNGQELADSDSAAVEQTIAAIQSLAEKEVEETELEFPRAFGLETGTGEAADAAGNGGPNAADLAAGVDTEMLEEYLSQQETVVPEVEGLVLSYEKQADPQVLKEFKRLLHTAKGEAGVIGLNRMEQVCHQVEDYIQIAETNLQADLLLEFKDWFEQAVAALRNGAEMPSADNLLEELAEQKAEPGGGPESGPEPEPAGQAPACEDVQAAEEKPEEQDKAPGPSDAEKEELLSPVEIDDPEITADFISEANEHFEISDENLLTLENDPENEEAIASIFRAFHTIKGTTSFLGLTPISKLAHKAENLLDEVRRKHLDFDGLVVDATFNALDLLKTMTRDLENAVTAGEMFIPNPEMPKVFGQLKRAMAGEAAPAASKPKAAPADDSQQEPGTSDPEKEAAPESVDAPSAPGGGDAPARATSGNGGGQQQAGKAVKQTMKIDADRIDLLLETIGELVIVESIVSQEAGRREGENRELDRNLGQLTKITRSLQDMGMSMRLIPIDNTFRKMGRLVRDLAKKSGKKIELAMEGRETELDKAMVEKLGDPLVHMVRNAVDHGIESSAQERGAAGKPPTATIVLKAYHQGGNIHIDIKDDGRGLDRDAIAAKAVERGIVSSTESMSDEEIFALIFEPGFSTAAQVTDVSGRGVGMDVVKSNIESMRGNVRIASKKGEGSTFTLVLPLTMAIIDGMIVRVGEERYILPLLSIMESFQPTSDMISTVSGKGETVPFRNRLLPMFRLYDLFDVPKAQTDPTSALVVVVEDAGRQVALMVDELLGQNQTVIKNLGEGLKDVEGIAGASIMPDGTPGLIIDVSGLVKMAMG